jgi:hypothetical protein
MNVQNERIAKFIFEATGMELRDIQQRLMGKRRSLSAEEATTQKIVLEVKKEKIPPGALRKNIIYV